MKEALLESHDPVLAQALTLLSSTWPAPGEACSDVRFRSQAVHAVRRAPSQHQWGVAGLLASVSAGSASSTADRAELAQGLRALIGVARMLRRQSLDRPATWLLMQALDLAVRSLFPSEEYGLVPLTDLLPHLSGIDASAAKVVRGAWEEPWGDLGAAKLKIACRLAIDLLTSGGGAT